MSRPLFAVLVVLSLGALAQVRDDVFQAASLRIDAMQVTPQLDGGCAARWCGSVTSDDAGVTLRACADVASLSQPVNLGACQSLQAAGTAQVGQVLRLVADGGTP
jgi:hypothetical protein